MLLGKDTSSGGLDFNFSSDKGALAVNHQEEIEELVQTSMSRNIFRVMYISHTLPGDPLLNNLTMDQLTWYLMAYQDMQTEDNLASQEYYDSLEGQGSVPMGNTSTGGTNKRALYATDENGMKYKAGDVADFGDDDYSWHDGDDIDLIPGGLDKASIEQQLREISAKDQTEYLDAIAGGDFTANSQFSEYQQQKMRDSKNEEADRVLRELQEKSKYLEETGQSRPLVK